MRDDGIGSIFMLAWESSVLTGDSPRVIVCGVASFVYIVLSDVSGN